MASSHKAKIHVMYIARQANEGPACRLALDASMRLHCIPLRPRLLLPGDVVTFNTDISQIRSRAGYRQGELRM
jgi:hypothetical protein